MRFFVLEGHLPITYCVVTITVNVAVSNVNKCVLALRTVARVCLTLLSGFLLGAYCIDLLGIQPENLHFIIKI